MKPRCPLDWIDQDVAYLSHLAAKARGDGAAKTFEQIAQVADTIRMRAATEARSIEDQRGEDDV